MKLTAERLREVLAYDKHTGEFIWAKKLSSRGAIGSVAGCFDPEGYRSIGIDGGKYRCCRLAWLYTHGSWPSGQIDHINGLKSDDRIENLRDVSAAVNAQNRRVAMRNNVSGVLGVSWRARYAHWRVSVVIGGKQREIGTYKSLDAARTASIEARKKHYEGFLL